jgi:hypothetical protein
MDGSRFDAWTRRRFGLAASGALAAFLGLIGNDVAEAAKHKHHHKKRCRKLGRACTHGGQRKCCHGLTCDTIGLDSTAQKHCCRTEGKGCSSDDDCCGALGCSPGPDRTCLLPSSDRNLKANFGSVDPGDILTRVRNLPISTWNYTADDPTVRHIGPMAQDFTATFGVGADDRHIHPIDGQGVALAAIQGLVAELDRLRVENTALAARGARLEDDA